MAGRRAPGPGKAARRVRKHPFVNAEELEICWCDRTGALNVLWAIIGGMPRRPGLPPRAQSCQRPLEHPQHGIGMRSARRHALRHAGSGPRHGTRRALGKLVELHHGLSECPVDPDEHHSDHQRVHHDREDL